MATQTEIEPQTLATAAGYRVTATGILGGEPALLGFYSLLTLSNGTQRHIGQVARVVDRDLLQRLRDEVRPGDEIRVSTEVDAAVPDCPTVLTDFRPI